MKLGIGYLLGAADKGVKKALKVVFGGLTDTEEAAEGATRESGKLRDMLLGLQSLQLHDIRGSLDDIRSGAQGIASSGLDTEIESMFVSFDQGFASAAVRSGIMGAELKSLESQVFSTAFAMNRSADEVGNNVLALERAGLTLEQILGKGGTMADYQKMLEVTGMEAGSFTSVFNDLNKSWGFGEEGARDFFDAFSNQAAVLGIGEEAFGALPGMITEVDKAFAHLDMKPADIQSAMLGIAKLGAGLQEAIGEDPQASMQKATQMFAAIAGEAATFDKMMVGMGSGLGDLTSELTFLDGGLDGTLQRLSDGAKDPAVFMSELGNTFAALEADGSAASKTLKDRLLHTLTDLDPSFSFMAQQGTDLTTMFSTMTKQVDKSSVSLRDMSNQGYRSGLTLGEGVDRARMSMEQAFGGATRKDREAFASSMRKSYGLVGTTIRNLTVDTEEANKAWLEQAAGMGLSVKAAERLKGPLGSVVEYMGIFASAGVHGVLVKMFGEDSAIAAGIGVMASGFASLAMTLLPIVILLRPIAGPIIKGLVKSLGFLTKALIRTTLPIGWIITAISLLSLAIKGKLDDAIISVKETLENAFIWMATKGADLLNRVTDWFSNLDGKKTASAAMTWIKSTIAGIFSGFDREIKGNPMVKKVAVQFWNALKGAVMAGGRFVRDFASSVIGKMSSVDWGVAGYEIGQKVTGAIINFFSKAKSFATEMAPIVSDLIGQAFEFVTTPEYWATAFGYLWEGLKLVMSYSAGIAEFVGGIFMGIGQAATDALFGEGTWAAGWNEFSYQIGRVATWFTDLWETIKEGAFNLFGNSINTFVEHDFGKIFEIIETAKGWFGVLADVVSAVFRGVVSAIGGFFDHFKLIGALVTKLADKFGFKAEDAAVVVNSTPGQNTKGTQALVSRAGDSALITTIIEQHTQDRQVLNKILARLGASAAAGAAPSATVSGSASPSAHVAQGLH